MIIAGTPPAGYVFDRAYLTEENLDYVTKMGLKCIFMVRNDRIRIKNAIADAGANDRIVRDGEFINDAGCYALEYDFPYSYKKEGSGPGRGECMPQRLVVIFRPDRKGTDILELSNTIADLCDSAGFHMNGGLSVDDALMRKYTRFLDVEVDGDGLIKSLCVDTEKRDEAFSRCGFNAFMCCNMPKDQYPASDVLHCIRSVMPRIRRFAICRAGNSDAGSGSATEESVRGRLFIHFVAFILNFALHVEYSRSA